jgi:hypothetical protein
LALVKIKVSQPLLAPTTSNRKVSEIQPLTEDIWFFTVVRNFYIRKDWMYRLWEVIHVASVRLPAVIIFRLSGSVN